MVVDNSPAQLILQVLTNYTGFHNIVPADRFSVTHNMADTNNHIYKNKLIQFKVWNYRILIKILEWKGNITYTE